jgi:CubicO group peptidase (beta-lactamase class C family)
MNRRTFLKTGLGCLGASLPTLSIAAEVLASSPQNNSFDKDELRAVEDLAKRYMRRYNVPGLSLAITKEGALVYNQAFGFADPKEQEPLTQQHRFRIASLSKPITSVCIFKLVELGKLNLSDKVFGKVGILTDRFKKVRKNYNLEQVTIQYLLTHMVGGWGNDVDDPMFSNNKMDHDELIYWTLENRRLKKSPGDKFKYSNFGYCLLGRVIEEITKKSYQDAVGELVFQPCGMTSCDLAGNTLAERKPIEVVYSDQNGYDPYGFNFRRMDSHGGWISTSQDLARFLVHVDGFQTKNDILNLETIKTMTTSNSPGYAMGWCVNNNNNWWHGGNLQGSLSFMVRSNNGLCMVALINSRRVNSSMEEELDKLTWDMVGQFKKWPSNDLFSYSN